MEIEAYDRRKTLINATRQYQAIGAFAQQGNGEAIRVDMKPAAFPMMFAPSAKYP